MSRSCAVTECIFSIVLEGLKGMFPYTETSNILRAVSIKNLTLTYHGLINTKGPSIAPLSSSCKNVRLVLKLNHASKQPENLKQSHGHHAVKNAR